MAVQYPGREVRFNEPFADCHRALACDIAGLIVEQRYDHSRLVLFGHSFGAAIAFEVVRELERLRLPPRLSWFQVGLHPMFEVNGLLWLT